MAVLRKHLSSGFTTIPNEALRDPRLSYKATGLLAVLLSHSDGWNISAASMARGKPDGISAIRSGYDELVTAGYLRREQGRDSRGRISTVIHVSDTSMEGWIGLDDGRESDDLDTESCDSQPDDWSYEQGPGRLESHDLDTESFDSPTLDKPTSAEAPPIEVTGEKTSQGKRDTDMSAEADESQGADIIPIGAKVSLAEAGRKVLAAWVEATNREPGRAKLNAKRNEKIRARLNEGYSVEDLVSAVRGIAISPFHQGQNESGKKFDDIHVALRDGEQVEKFRDLFEEGGVNHRKSAAEQAAEMYRERGLL